jgi:hypothetical protein
MNDVVLLADNQFGHDGPQAGDRGRIVGKFTIPDETMIWYRVMFDGHGEMWFACPANMLKARS